MAVERPSDGDAEVERLGDVLEDEAGVVVPHPAVDDELREGGSESAYAPQVREERSERRRAGGRAGGREGGGKDWEGREGKTMKGTHLGERDAEDRRPDEYGVAQCERPGVLGDERRELPPAEEAARLGDAVVDGPRAADGDDDPEEREEAAERVLGRRLVVPVKVRDARLEVGAARADEADPARVAALGGDGAERDLAGRGRVLGVDLGGADVREAARTRGRGVSGRCNCVER